MQERTGNWLVSIHPDSRHAVVTAKNVKTGDVRRTSMIHFPVGWRVGRLWDGHVPKTVIVVANRLARRADKTPGWSW